MNIRPQMLYDYIFCDHADIEASAKKIPEARRAEYKTQRIAKIKELFKAETFELHFREVLHFLKAESLEAVLYGSCANQDNLNPRVLRELVRSDAFIMSKFQLFLEEYPMFALQSGSQKYEESCNKYRKFFWIFKIIGDYVEKNNYAWNELAVMHTDKMFLIFGDQDEPSKSFQSFEKYIKIHNFAEESNPVHDVLVWNLPIKDRNSFNTLQFDLTAWRKMIQTVGVKAFRLFNLAYVIDAKLQRAPKNFQEALEVAKTIAYKNAAADFELAELCISYNVREDVFNKCLEVKKNRKSYDRLPNIITSLTTQSHSKYYLVKLPIDDPKAFLLGLITNCCQSIGGHSQKCVIDGVTRPNNGFYVLLKDKSKKSSDEKQEVKEQKFSSIMDEVRYLIKQCKIMGQGYAWLSATGNLTFDSWENLNPQAEDPIIVPLLQQFAKEATEQKDTSILRVTIGRGGKTPPEFDKEAIYPEQMLEGYQYGDSSSQALVYFNHERLQALNDDLERELNKVFAAEVLGEKEDKLNRIKSLLIPKDCYSTSRFNTAKALLKNQEMLDFIKTPEGRAILFRIAIYEDLCKKLELGYSRLFERIELAQEVSGKTVSVNKTILAVLATYVKNHCLLYSAIQRKDVVAVKEIIALGHDMNAISGAEGYDESPALMSALDEPEILNLLIRAKANVNKTGSGGHSPLASACVNSKPRSVICLLNAKANVNVVDIYGKTPLHHAAEQSDFFILNALIGAKAKVNAATKVGVTPLHCAANTGRISFVKALLEAKANVHAVHKESGYTALHLAAGDCSPHCAGGRLESALKVIDILLSARADINALDKKQKTPLFWAVDVGCTKAVRALIIAGANVNASVRHKSMTKAPLLTAINRRDLEMVQQLLDAKADANFNDKEEGGALHIIGSRHDDIALLEMLLAAKADINMQGLSDGGTILHEVLKSCNPSLYLVNKLLEAKADVNAVNFEGRTPAHIALWKEGLQVSHMLLEAKADIDIEDKSGRSVFSYFESVGQVPVLLYRNIQLHHVVWLNDQVKALARLEEKNSCINAPELLKRINDIACKDSREVKRFSAMVDALTKVIRDPIKQYEVLSGQVKQSLMTRNPYDDIQCATIYRILQGIQMRLVRTKLDLPEDKFNAQRVVKFDSVPAHVINRLAI